MLILRGRRTRTAESTCPSDPATRCVLGKRGRNAGHQIAGKTCHSPLGVAVIRSRAKLRADIDRLVSLRVDETPERHRLSAFRDRPSYVLLGEPGSGKSTAFAREAEAAGSHVVTALRFVGGHRPNGRVVFIDALEEYRIGEVGVDRLQSLIDAVAASDYDQWRLACRAISLPPADAFRIADRIGEFDTLQLEPLEGHEQSKILEVIGEADPAAFRNRVEVMGAGGLMGNPSNLLLLHDTLDRAEEPIGTRGALLAEATRQMAHELNPDMPERSDRPPPTRIIAAAEVACLVLLLSSRTDIWMHAALPPDRKFVTRDDLLPARVDTQALRAALDTAMFNGDGDTFIPTHRFVAEYLGGHALARATAPTDPHVPALSVNRAIAFLHGDNDRPAPALTGIYAWFVTALAQTLHAERALELVRRDPEAVLFHGDAAMLPPVHRRTLLDAIGREDPWFLRGNSGSTALAGLAGSDLAEPMKAILTDPGESANRKALVLMALGAGRPVPELAETVHAIYAKEGAADHFDRRLALHASANIAGRSRETYRALLDALAGQTSPASIQLRIELLSLLVPGAAPEEIRETLLDYARTGHGVLGYARPLSTKLEEHPIAALFDEPLELRRRTGEARYHEVAALLDRVLAAAIEATPELSAERLLRWLAHVGLDVFGTRENEIRAAIAQWMDATPSREAELLAAIVARIDGPGYWAVPYDFYQLTGRDVSVGARTSAVASVEATTDDEISRDTYVAFALIRPIEDHPGLYWRLWAALNGRAGCEAIFAELTTCSVEDWRVEDAARKREWAADRAKLVEADRAWYEAHSDDVLSGVSQQGLYYAAKVYLGYAGGEEWGYAVLVERIGGPELVSAILTGWREFAWQSTDTVAEVGRRSVGSTVFGSDLVRVAWADHTLQCGDGIQASLPTLFAIANYAYWLRNEREGAVRAAAIEAIYTSPAAARAIGDFWAGAIAARSTDLPLGHDLDPNQACVQQAIHCVLERRPALREPILRYALQLAARCLGSVPLLELARKALARPLPVHARRLWSFLALMLDPSSQLGILRCEFRDAEGHEAFAQLLGSDLGKLSKMEGDEALLRHRMTIAELGPTWDPPRGRDVHRATPGHCVGAAIESLSQTPTASASDMLAEFIAVPSLSAWRDTLQHALARQRELRRQTEFRPPAPAAIAAALVAGPPATAGDLRAIIKESLEELAEHIRHGDTSPWKGFWNRPTRNGTTPVPVNTPKIENDCRDLLTDRLADRLRHYGIPVKQVRTEDRSGNDRRADVMIVLGDGAASVPIEAKRHWNSELWTAVTNQLLPYCRSAGSNGHGIYLVFWFGTAWQVPAPPEGRPRPDSATALREQLIGCLPCDVARSISVVVIDLSEPQG